MTDKEFKKQRKRIRKLMDKWRDRLWLQEWWITNSFSRGAFESNGDYDALAATSVQWAYRQATITWDMEAVSNQTDEELERVFVHEIMHIHLNEMREEGLAHEERVASTLALLITRLVDN